MIPQSAFKPSATELWYDQPAKTWDEAVPVGNGRLGAMVYGRTDTELLQLNENSVYYGGKQDRTPYGAHQHLPQLRRFIRDGEHAKAEELVNLAFIPNPSAQRHYEPLATLKLLFGHGLDEVVGYRRSLDLKNGIASTVYEHDGVAWKRQLIASRLSDVMIVTISASKRSRYIVRLSRFGELDYDTNEFYDEMKTVGDSIIMNFATGGAGGIQTCCAISAVCTDDGSAETIGNNIVVNSASVSLIIAGQTSFRCSNPSATALRDIDEVRDEVNEYRATDRSKQNEARETRARLVLNMETEDDSLPTDVRLQREPTAKLFELYHNFGQHLMLSSSRKAHDATALPSNLQGLWNPSFSPPWGCRFTININTQMNYWPCHIWGLASCSDPLFMLLERMAQRGQVTAREVYGSQREGAWCAHHSTDLWADTDPVDRWMPSALWPLGGAWLCLHIWERYLFEGAADEICGSPFLQRMLPVMEGAVKFLLDLLVEDKDGRYLVTCPSLSPENAYWQTSLSGKRVEGHFCEGSTMDIQIVSALLKTYLDAVATGNVQYDKSMPAEVSSALARLSPMQIGSDERLQEWQQPYDEPEPGHRHFSHLFGLYPGTTITPASTPELAEACRKTLSHRLAHGGAHTGWSRAWLICLYARLGDGEECLKHLRLLLRDSTLPNMFDTHPPMQIDGNFGACAGILEMLIQSHEVQTTASGVTRRIVRLLPACPKQWLEDGGALDRVKARGGLEVSFSWKHGKLVGALSLESQGQHEFAVVWRDGRQGIVPRSRWKCLWPVTNHSLWFREPSSSSCVPLT